MTESEWLVSADVLSLRSLFLAGGLFESKGSGRKFRLFVCACWRRIWHILTDARSRAAVEAAERYADGLATREELLAAHRKAERAFRAMATGRIAGNSNAAGAAAAVSAEVLFLSDIDDWFRLAAEAVVWEECPECAAHCALLRDVFGNPFRPITRDASWQSANVLALAEAAYDQRLLPGGQLDPTRLTVLADAWEEAGCTDQAILDHLHGAGPHIRGCWPVDLLLAKE
jgi:hypothetical protein